MSNFKDDIEIHSHGFYNEDSDEDDSDKENSDEKIQMKKIEHFNFIFRGNKKSTINLFFKKIFFELEMFPPEI